MDYSVIPAYILFAAYSVWYCIETVLIIRHGQGRRRQRRLIELSGIAILMVLLVVFNLLPTLFIGTITFGSFEFPAVFVAVLVGALTIGLSWYLWLVEFVEGRQNKAKDAEEAKANAQEGVWPPPPSTPAPDKTGKTAGK